MNCFRSVFFMRIVVFLMAFLMLHDSIDTRVVPATPRGDSSIQLLVKAADEHGSDDWERRLFGTETNLYEAPVMELEFVSPYKIITGNFSNVTNQFKSVPSELPSPPPKA